MPLDHNPLDFLSEKSVLHWRTFSGNLSSLNQVNIADCRMSGNCRVVPGSGNRGLVFEGQEGAHRAAFILPSPFKANGLLIRLRLSNWHEIRYLAFGYACQGLFRHIKIVNPPQDQWVIVNLQHGDIGFGLQNNWEHPDSSDVGDVKIYLKAEPILGGAMVEVDYFTLWEEAEISEPGKYTCTRPVILPERTLLSEDLLNILYGYLGKCFRRASDQAVAFMTTGVCPLYGEIQLDWPDNQILPSDLGKVGTYAFSWHSLHPAAILLIYARNTGDDAPVFAARDIVSNWLDRSYYRIDDDKKFAWYDHGVAERQLTFLLMWAEGVKRRFDHRFMKRLAEAIVRHAQLLESELFYASHQFTRYHNHAWFQDLALMATALAIPEYPASQRWMTRATERLTDQLKILIVRDNGFSVFVENSIGYHQGVQRIVELAGDMVRLAGKVSSIPDIAVELSRFSDFFRYPDNRSPAQGDTFRRGNPPRIALKKAMPYIPPEIVLLSKAGYGVVKGNHDGQRFMLCMFATSICKTHKHEDNLSFTLFFDGLEWLIDPSFYSHEYKASIPSYLRSAAGHNNIYLPGVSYSIEPGNAFLDGEIDGDNFKFDGHHTAYLGYEVSRSLSGKNSELNFRVIDRVRATSDGEVRAKLMLHCGEGVVVSQENYGFVLSHPDSLFEIVLTLPINSFEKFSNRIDENFVRGISGTGFMNTSVIQTLECLLSENGSLEWSINARRGCDHSVV